MLIQQSMLKPLRMLLRAKKVAMVQKFSTVGPGCITALNAESKKAALCVVTSCITKWPHFLTYFFLLPITTFPLSGHVYRSLRASSSRALALLSQLQAFCLSPGKPGAGEAIWKKDRESKREYSLSAKWQHAFVKSLTQLCWLL